MKEQRTTYDLLLSDRPVTFTAAFKTTSVQDANSIEDAGLPLLADRAADRLVWADGQERKKYRIERHTSKLFAACASMLGSKLPVFS